MSPLILERASASRQSGQWRDDDYDVLEDGVVVGRIFKVQVALADKPWMWASGHNGDVKRAAHAYTSSRLKPRRYPLPPGASLLPVRSSDKI